MRGHCTPKKPAPQDWHKADIKAALEKAGWTLRRLAASLNINPTTLRDTFRKSYPASERRIAAALGKHPMEIWPSRYDENGLPVGRRGRSQRRANRSTRRQRSAVKGAASN